jgi:asparagine synthase (glutamine-hydrolysing)
VCGIAGIFGKADAVTLDGMLAAMTHRGPDDGFSVTGDGFCIGVRRLSIIDVKMGRQPLSNEDGKVWVAQNGEIYNFKKLRDELLSKGHQFKTNTDTEVIAHVYEEYVGDLPLALDGMFAIALWDSNERQGILVRDRIGKKPLYYTMIGNCLYFASEIKALLQTPGFKREINLEALHYYLGYKHIPCPLSIFKGIQQLPPASVLTYNNGSITIRRYWHPNFSPADYPTDADESEWVKLLTVALNNAVRSRLIGDVPIGFLLSGGVDSGLITAMASGMVRESLDTFNLSYSLPQSNTGALPNTLSNSKISEGKKRDTELARVISKLYNTRHHEETIDCPNLPDELPKIVACFDEPFAGVTSTYFLAGAISKHVKVAITGDGADELFGSYLSHRMASQGQDAYDWDWRYGLLTFSDDDGDRIYSRDTLVATMKYNTKAHLKKYFDNLTAKDPLNRMLEMEFKSFLPDQVLTFADRLSMAHSLELRSPYLDTQFVNLANKIPGSLKIKKGETKYILKKVAMKYLPSEVVSRKKEGFIAPVTEWLYHNLQDYVRGILSKERLAKHSIFKCSAVEKLVNGFYEREYDYRTGNKILSLVMFQIWYDLYMGRSSIQ